MTTYTLPLHITLPSNEQLKFVCNDITLVHNKHNVAGITCMIVTNQQMIFTTSNNNDNNRTIALNTIIDQKVSKATMTTIKQMLTTVNPANDYIITYTNKQTADSDRQVLKLLLIDAIAKNKSRDLAALPKPTTPTNHTTSTPTITQSVTVKTEPGLVATQSIPAKRNNDATQSNIVQNNKKPANNNHKQSDTLVTSELIDLTDSTESSVIEARVELLRRDSELRQLHKDLVKSGIISENEFWSSRQAEITAAQNNITAQERGISSTQKSKPTANTNNADTTQSTKIRIDKSTIHEIFMTKPAVYRAYQDQVPLQMTEKEFWTRYYRVQKLKEAKQLAATGQTQALRPDIDMSDEQLFASYEQIHNESIDATKRLKVQRYIDPSVDLTAADMSDNMRNTEAGEIDADTVIDTNNVNKIVTNKRNTESNDIIQNYNRHSNLIVETGHLHQPTVNNNNNINVNNTANIQTIQQQQYHKDLIDSLRFTDLEPQQQPDYHTLNIDQHYYNTNTVELNDKQKRTIESAELKLYNEIQKWNLKADLEPNHVICDEPDSSLCYSILTALSYQNKALNNASIINRNTTLVQQQATQQQHTIKIYSTTDDSSITVPVQFQSDLKQMYNKLIELLRHYWDCFPVAPQTRAQMERLKHAIDTHSDYIQSYRSTLYSDNQAQLVQLLKPMIDAVNKANDAYDGFRRRETEVRLRCQQAKAAMLAQQQIPLQT